VNGVGELGGTAPWHTTAILGLGKLTNVKIKSYPWALRASQTKRNHTHRHVTPRAARGEAVRIHGVGTPWIDDFSHHSACIKLTSGVWVSSLLRGGVVDGAVIRSASIMRILNRRGSVSPKTPNPAQGRRVRPLDDWRYRGRREPPNGEVADSILSGVKSFVGLVAQRISSRRGGTVSDRDA
jgi:hypothetical protein